MSRFQKLAVATAAVTVVLFAVGGLVRGSQSGLGCSTWPDCTPGRLFPTGTVHSLIEFSHRTLAVVVIVLTLACAVAARRGFADLRAITWPAFASAPLALAQAIIGGVVVLTDLEPKWSVTAHFVTALALIGCVTILAVNALLLTGPGRDPGRIPAGFGRLVVVTTAVVGALLLVGTWVRASGSQLVFTDWPLMHGRLIPTLGGAATVMFLHRVLAVAGLLLILWTAIRARSMHPRSRPIVILSTVAVILFVAQVAVGAANVVSRLQPWAIVAHVGLAVLIWGALVALAAVSRICVAAPDTVDELPARGNAHRTVGSTVASYTELMKPRIILLLLITTLPAMILAKHGLPSPWLMLATLTGGALAAGSANAVNMYLDRDIDEVMRRTRSRPLPARAVTPDQSLAFGFALGAVSFFLLAISVNVVAATLSLAAIAFYVFVYTMWLKRRTVQNIVIGGAAGAVPALVGWAAVTGSVGMPALILFAIVFVWTPPHFWALAMRFQGDYAVAGIPMLPVVRGEEETRRQIFLYSLVLFGTTLVLAPVGHMGPIYVSTAVVLGGVFVWRSLQLWRDARPGREWRLFRYSIWYLAALFGSVAVDALLRS